MSYIVIGTHEPADRSRYWLAASVHHSAAYLEAGFSEGPNGPKPWVRMLPACGRLGTGQRDRGDDIALFVSSHPGLSSL